MVRALFEGGLMGVEIPAAYGGTGSTFFSSVLCVEELAKYTLLPYFSTSIVTK